MKTDGHLKKFIILFNVNPAVTVTVLVVINFLIRLIIYYNTRLFYFADYSAYLKGIESIASGEKIYLLKGNFMFTVSYLGYFSKYILGSLDFFFLFNCLVAALTSFVLYLLIVKVTNSRLAGLITILIHTFYSEFMVFSSIFYTPILMMFLTSLFILISWYYFTTRNQSIRIFSALAMSLVFLLTFFFKPELKYLPWFLLIPGLIYIRANISFSKRLLTISCLLLFASYILGYSGLITQPKDNVISNTFVFFGHTDYGGDGGEGSFIYPENKMRYENALAEYCKSNNIISPTTNDYNAFQSQEMFKFVTNHPFKWISLQFTKFFRTFGVVPETNSFKVLYTGLIKGNLWLTSIIVVAPVACILLLFIIFFNFSIFRQIHDTKTEKRMPKAEAHRSEILPFLIVYFTIFIYYIIAIIFYGQYQERYRLPVMVIFIIPVLGYQIATFDRKMFLNRVSLIIKGTIVIILLTIWTLQAKNAIHNKLRLENALELTEKQIGK